MEGTGWLPDVLNTPNARGPFELTEQGCAAIAAEQSLRRSGGASSLLRRCQFALANVFSAVATLHNRVA